MIRPIVSVSSFCCCASLVGLFGFTGCSSGTVAVPSNYANFNSSDGTFACDYPQDWTGDGSKGTRGLEWGKFSSGPAEIRIEAGAAGSLVGDIAKNLGGQKGEEGPESEPVHTVHMEGEEAAKKQFDGYTDKSGPQVFQTSLGPARRSEFTSSTTFGTGMHGYRVTVLAHDKAVYAYCICPEDNWATLEPAFTKVMSSLTRGKSP